MDETSDDLGMSNQGFATQARLLRDLNTSASSFGRILTKAFSSGVVEGKRFEDILRSVGTRLSETALKAAFKPIESGLSGFLNQGINALGGSLFGGSAQSLGSVQAFADGGIVGQPTYFGMGRNLGLMGEAGAEAILPLARGSDGKLGVSGGGGGQSVNVTLNISTPDADSFRRSEGQVSATIARAVARGRRSL